MPTLLAGRFELDEESPRLLQLIPATDRQTGAPVLIRIQDARNPDSQRRLARVGRLLSRLRHPGLARILDVLEEGQRVIVVQESHPGRTLSEAAAGQALPIPLVQGALQQLAAALEFLHGQDPPLWIGRLDPSGILLTPGDRVLIADVVSDEDEAIEQVRTPYWAPEVEARAPATAAQDLYSLGALGWLLASGGPPRSLPLPQDCPPVLSELLEDLLQVDPGLRPASVRAVLARFETPPARPEPVAAATPAVARPSMWNLLFGGSPRPATPSAVPEDEGEHARRARDHYSLLDLAEVELEREVARVLPEATARAIQGVVVARPQEHELVLALKDPTFVDAAEDEPLVHALGRHRFGPAQQPEVVGLREVQLAQGSRSGQGLEALTQRVNDFEDLHAWSEAREKNQFVLLNA